MLRRCLSFVVAPHPRWIIVRECLVSGDAKVSQGPVTTGQRSTGLTSPSMEIRPGRMAENVDHSEVGKMEWSGCPPAATCDPG